MRSLVFLTLTVSLYAQQPPYDVFPSADPPYYRVRYEASTKPGELIFPVNYTIWVPPGAKTLRGVIVHEVLKLRAAEPTSTSWARDQVRNMLN